MTSTLGSYVRRVFAVHVLVALAGLVLLAQLFDLLASAEELFKLHGADWRVAVRYLWLRLPALLVLLLPFATLLGSLTAFAQLARRHEVVAMKASGLPFLRLPAMLLPALILLALAQWVLADRIAPPVLQRLFVWQTAAQLAREDPAEVGERPSLWLRTGGDVIGVTAVLDQGRHLYGMQLYQRQPSGALSARTVAREAVYADGLWRLRDGSYLPVLRSGSPAPQPFEERPWATALRPHEILTLAMPPAMLPLGELRRMIGQADLGHLPDYVYATHWHHGLAVVASPFLMGLLGVPAAQLLRRRGGIALPVALALALGFIYLLVDGVLVGLGEAGVLPPPLAGWAALGLFGCLAGTALLWADR